MPQTSHRVSQALKVKLDTNVETIGQSVFIEFAMIQLQVHLQLPCYDFCPVQAIAIKVIYNWPEKPPTKSFLTLLETAQSRTATGGVYKGQGHNLRELMTHTY